MVNSFEEVVGVLSVEDVLEQVIGGRIASGFDQYDNLPAVAGASSHRNELSGAAELKGNEEIITEK